MATEIRFQNRRIGDLIPGTRVAEGGSGVLECRQIACAKEKLHCEHVLGVISTSQDAMTSVGGQPVFLPPICGVLITARPEYIEWVRIDEPDGFGMRSVSIPEDLFDWKLWPAGMSRHIGFLAPGEGRRALRDMLLPVATLMASYGMPRCDSEIHDPTRDLVREHTGLSKEYMHAVMFLRKHGKCQRCFEVGKALVPDGI